MSCSLNGVQALVILSDAQIAQIAVSHQNTIHSVCFISVGRTRLKHGIKERNKKGASNMLEKLLAEYLREKHPEKMDTIMNSYEAMTKDMKEEFWRWVETYNE